MVEWIGEWIGGSGDGAVWIDPSGELLSALAGGRMVSGEAAESVFSSPSSIDLGFA